MNVHRLLNDPLLVTLWEFLCCQFNVTALTILTPISLAHT